MKWVTRILVRPKGTNKPWVHFGCSSCTDVADAKHQIRQRSDAIDKAFDFGIETVSFEEYSERKAK